MINKNFNVIEVVDATAIANNEVFPNNTIITFYNDASKFKISDGKTAFNDLEYFTSGGGGESITLENGLRLQDGVGKLGLDLTTIGITNEGYITELTYLVSGDLLSSYGGVIFNSTTTDLTYGNNVSLESTSIKTGESELFLLKTGLGATQSQYLRFAPTSNLIILTDEINSKGLEYGSDYSANYTDRSLVDKAYVDAAIAAALNP